MMPFEQVELFCLNAFPELIEDDEDVEQVLSGADDFDTVCVLEQLEAEEDLDLVGRFDLEGDLDLVRCIDLEVASLLAASEIMDGTAAGPATFPFSGSDMGTLGSCD